MVPSVLEKVPVFVNAATVEVVLETAVGSLNTVVLVPTSKTDETLIVVELDLDEKVKLERDEADRQRHDAEEWQSRCDEADRQRHKAKQWQRRQRQDEAYCQRHEAKQWRSRQDEADHQRCCYCLPVSTASAAVPSRCTARQTRMHCATETTRDRS